MALTRIEFRRGVASEWTAENPVLTAGEPGHETDTGHVKVGDGTTAWNALPYVGDPVDPVELADILDASPPATAGTVSPLVLSQAVVALIEAAGIANVYMMPVWDGTGSQPARPPVPDTTFVIWRQPVAPLVGPTYSHDGDEWEATDGG